MAALPPREPAPLTPSSIKRFLLEHYDELHGMAQRHMAAEAAGNSLQATALMNEAVCQMLDPARKLAINDDRHFLATAQLMMKHILIDRARRHQAQKAGGQMQRKDLHENQADRQPQQVEVLILQEELNLLAQHDPMASKVIQKRCEGYSTEEAAEILGISRTAAYELWNIGRAWLLQKFKDGSTQS